MGFARHQQPIHSIFLYTKFLKTFFSNESFALFRAALVFVEPSSLIDRIADSPVHVHAESPKRARHYFKFASRFPCSFLSTMGTVFSTMGTVFSIIRTLACLFLPFIHHVCDWNSSDDMKVLPGAPRWIETYRRVYFWDWFWPPYDRRHVACFAFDSDVTQKAYLIGGILSEKQVDIYDPRSRKWSRGRYAPIEFHHAQCVAVDGKIYVVSAFTGTTLPGPFGQERPVSDIHVYDILTNTWSTKTGLPESRRRGGAAVVLHNRTLYVSHGGGHGQEAFGMLDAYEIDNDQWITGLPDAPNPREHAGGGLVNGTMLCVGGGQELHGNEQDESALILPTDCYNLETGTWSEEAALPRGRRAGSYGTTCDGKLIVSGGEALGRTWPNVDVFDGVSWTPLEDLVRSRFGHGMAIDCACNQMYVAAGAPTLPVLLFDMLVSVETYFPDGDDRRCSA